MGFNGTSVGLDVHALSVVAHAVDEETGQLEGARLSWSIPVAWPISMMYASESRR
ncbi:hypothetical protein [Mycobacterium sp. ACS1612]|uniref:hypothetical protein n=1 Tax=Mycobacterium sp. ACS1612 TaxID=1834117 RepID=UPI000A9803CC|nr:hypothetical protein [Mycobacterium sp. ACS1612]